MSFAQITNASGVREIISNDSQCFSVFENHRTRSLDCETSDITSNLAHLQNVRDVKLRGRSLSASVNDVTHRTSGAVTSLCDSYFDVLPSPRVSPEMFRNVPDVVVNTERGNESSGTLSSFFRLFIFSYF